MATVAVLRDSLALALSEPWQAAILAGALLFARIGVVAVLLAAGVIGVVVVFAGAGLPGT